MGPWPGPLGHFSLHIQGQRARRTLFQRTSLEGLGWTQKGWSPAERSARRLSPQSLPQQVGGEETDPRVCHRGTHARPSPWTGSEAPLTVWKVGVCPASNWLSSLHTLEESPGLCPPPRYCEMQTPALNKTPAYSTNASGLTGGQNAEMESKGKRTVSSPSREKALETLRSRPLKALTICLPGQELSGRKGRRN